MTLTSCEYKSEDLTTSFFCDLAAAENKYFRALSVAGNGEAIRGIAAQMRSSVARYQGTYNFKQLSGWDAVFAPESIEVRITNLEADLWHLVAWDVDQKYMINVDDDALYNTLMGEAFTTPMLKDWMPKIREQLYNNGALKPLKSFNCQAAVLLATPEGIDRIVSDGLRDGRLVI